MRTGRCGAWFLVGLLGLAAPRLEPDAPEASRAETSLASRLLGPIAPLAADIQWVRVHGEILAGRHAMALARAQAALSLDPGATAGWEMVAAHQGLFLASATREADPERRLAWLRAAVATTLEGEAVAREPAQLAFQRGLLLGVHASMEPLPPWPGGAAALREEASLAFERAALLGFHTTP